MNLSVITLMGGNKGKAGKAALLALFLLLSVLSCSIAIAERPADEPIMVNNFWVDVPLTQIFRDISMETGVVIALCPHVPDPLISLDADSGKPLKECLAELLPGQGLFVHQKNKEFYLISCGSPTCPSSLETTVSKRLYLKYITAKHLRTSLPRALQQHVSSGERKNEVLIYAVPDIAKHIMQIVNKLDVPREQIMLEVLVVDLWEDAGEEFGLNWDYTSRHFGFGTQDSSGDFKAIASFSSVATSGLTDLILTLEALISDKRASIRSRPRIATLNGEQAEINISLDEYYSIARDIYDSTIRTDLEIISSGVLLQMTPHIGDNGYITIDVLTEVSDVASRRDTTGNNDNLPVIRRRKANTKVRVREGDAIVIGGLVETQERKDDKMVPLLGQLPLIGGLFKSKDDSVSKKEVMIFITPRLIREGEITISERHDLIDEQEEVAKLQNVATFSDVRHKYRQNSLKIKEEIQCLREVVAILEGKRESFEEDDEDFSVSIYHNLLNPTEEIKKLRAVVALLDGNYQSGHSTNPTGGINERYDF